MTVRSFLDEAPVDPFADPALDPFADAEQAPFDPFDVATNPGPVPSDPFNSPYPNLHPVSDRNVVRLTTSRLEAQQNRARALIQVATGAMTFDQVIAEATTVAGADLLGIRLHALLEARPGAGTAAASSVITHLSRALGCKVADGVDLAWLLDARSHGRYVAWLTTTRRFGGTPWPGFPFTKHGNEN